MAEETSGVVEPDLSQFEPERWDFPTAQERAEYVAAFNNLRAAAIAAEAQGLHARFRGQPTVEILNTMTNILKKERENAG